MMWVIVWYYILKNVYAVAKDMDKVSFLNNSKIYRHDL